MVFRITREEWGLAFGIMIMGYALSDPKWLMYMDGLTPLMGFTIYYGILYGALFFGSKLKLVIFGTTITDVTQTVGLLLLNFAFHVTTNWQSPWVEWVTRGNLTGESNVYINNSEDGVLWWIVTTQLNVLDLNQARILTFVVLPFILAVVAFYLIRGRPRLM